MQTDRHKDDRSVGKRHKMKEMKLKRHGKKNPQENDQTSSSSAPQIRSIIDVADSSDDLYVARWTNYRNVPAQQRHLDLPDQSEQNELNDGANDQLLAADFDQVSHMPTSVGLPFQLINEKNWQTEENIQILDNKDAGDYFTLNLKLLNVGLQTIPFNKRMDYPSSMFERKQILAMEMHADKAEKSYGNVLKAHESKLPVKTNKNSSAKLRCVAQSDNGSDKKKIPDELDDLLDMTTLKVSKVGLNSVLADIVLVAAAGAATTETTTNAEASATNGKEDVQQWLDNVLEE